MNKTKLNNSYAYDIKENVNQQSKNLIQNNDKNKNKNNKHKLKNKYKSINDIFI